VQKGGRKNEGESKAERRKSAFLKQWNRRREDLECDDLKVRNV
jgi:hypothetical protein